MAVVEGGDLGQLTVLHFLVPGGCIEQEVAVVEGETQAT